MLIDTNVLVYSIDEESIFYERSRKILTSSMYHKVTTSKNLVEFLSVVTRQTGYDVETDIALEILEEVIQGIEVIYPNQESLAIVWQLLNQYQIKGLQIHDVEIASIGI